MRNKSILALVVARTGLSLALSCAPTPAAPPPAEPQREEARTPAAAANPAGLASPASSAPTPPSGQPGEGRPCGEFGCRFFETPQVAFTKVLESSPRILGIGEAHALSGTEQIESATRRFTRDFLPLLKERASDIVVELLIPNPKCRKETAKARQEQKVVTDRQATTDQNDYVVLANQARALGIRAHALEPTCDDLARIAAAGKDAIAESLEVITRLSRETLERLYQRNVAANDSRIVVAYGGAMHNDSTPRPGRGRRAEGCCSAC